MQATILSLKKIFFKNIEKSTTFLYNAYNNYKQKFIIIRNMLRFYVMYDRMGLYMKGCGYMYSALDIALWFLAKNHSEEKENLTDDENYEVYEGITHLKLQKLLYYAQGIYLALNSEPLFFEDIFAWQHGPVVPEVYDKYKINGRREINPLLNNVEKEKMIKVELNTKSKQALEIAYENFAGYTAWQLRNKTHEKGTPWNITISKYGEGAKIDNKLIEEYFNKTFFEE